MKTASEDDGSSSRLSAILVYIMSLSGMFKRALNDVMAYYPEIQQQAIARALNLTPSAYAHYLAGRRTPPIEFIPHFAKVLGLAPEIEELLIATWKFDRDMEALGVYAKAINDLKAYDRVGFLSQWLEDHYVSLQAARDRARSRFSTPGD